MRPECTGRPGNGLCAYTASLPLPPAADGETGAQEADLPGLRPDLVETAGPGRLGEDAIAAEEMRR